MKPHTVILSVVILLAGGFARAQEEQNRAARDNPSARYWTQPRVELNPHVGPALGPEAKAAPSRGANPQKLRIENETLEVRWDSQTAAMAVVSKITGHAFLTNVSFNHTGGDARATSLSDPTFGPGNAIEITYANGSRDAVALHPKLPFVLFRSALHNAGPDPIVIRTVRPLHAEAALGKPLSQLKTLGTGGLMAPGKDPGSYEWLAVADPQTRNGVVFGLLTHDRGDGVFFSRVQGPNLQVGAQIDYGRRRIMPGRSADLEVCAVGYFEDGRLGLEAWADAVAQVYKIKLPAQPVGYCTWYSRPNGGASDEVHLAEQAAFAARHLAPFGFSVVQIDDGWQAGFKRPAPNSSPKKNFTTHQPQGPYPQGMKNAADNLKSNGLVPGLWFMPFAGTFEDPFFAHHQDWFVKTPEGKPFDVPWGGASLDMTHPGARTHARDVASRISREWGFQYIKIDGLWTGTATRQLYVNSGYKEDEMGEAVFHDPDKSNLEAYRDGLKLVREAVGPGVFILGCNGPQNMRSYGGALGLVDGMRVGPDNGAEWSRLRRGPLYGSRHYFLNGRVWYNDPDPVYVRDSMPLNHAQLICSWVALSDQLNLSSEWFPGLPPERLDILKRTMPYHHRTARPVDFFEEDLPRIWLVSDTQHAPRRDVIGLFNWSDAEQKFDYPLDHLGLDASIEYQAFDYWGNRPLPPFKGRLQATVPGQCCLILAVRSKAAHPQLISTSRHVTQGMVDVLAEQWTEATKTLTGRSRLVGGDSCELRFAGASTASTIEVAAADKQAGVTAELVSEGQLLRAKILAPASREVTWTVRFK